MFVFIWFSLLFNCSVVVLRRVEANLFLQKPESIAYKKASDWVTDDSLFDHWVQRYIDSLIVKVIYLSLDVAYR